MLSLWGQGGGQGTGAAGDNGCGSWTVTPSSTPAQPGPEQPVVLQDPAPSGRWKPRARPLSLPTSRLLDFILRVADEKTVPWASKQPEGECVPYQAARPGRLAGRARLCPVLPSCQPATKNQEQMLENHNTQEEKPYAEGRVQHKEIKTKTKKRNLKQVMQGKEANAY